MKVDQVIEIIGSFDVPVMDATATFDPTLEISGTNDFLVAIEGSFMSPFIDMIGTSNSEETENGD